MRLLPDSWSTMGFIPRSISCYLVPGFAPSAARFVRNTIIPKEVCRVFVLWCQSASHLTCFVLFVKSPVIIQSIHSYIHAFIQSYIHTLILSHIHTLMHTQHIHDILLLLICSNNVSVCCLLLFKKNPFVPPEMKVYLCRDFCFMYFPSLIKSRSYPGFAFIFAFFWKNGNTKNQKIIIILKYLHNHNSYLLVKINNQIMH